MKEITQIVGEAQCPNHGKYSYTAFKLRSKVVGMRCPECMRERQTIAEDLNRAADDVASRAALRLRLTNAGIPPGFMNAHMANLTTPQGKSEKIVQTLNQYITNFAMVLSQRPAPGIIFCGVPGTGKTHVACAVVRALITSGFSAVYTSAPQYLLLMKDAQFGRHEISATQLAAQFAAPNLLVLDEYGTHTTTDLDYQLLFGLIDARYQANLPTLLITNITQKELGKQIDERLLERVRGDRGPLFAFDWASLRSSQQQQTR